MSEKVTIAGIIKDVGSSTKTKTGTWRVFKPCIGGCKGCKTCIQFCPEGVISFNEKTKKIEIDYDYCKGCGICAEMCPFKAIKMEREQK